MTERKFLSLVCILGIALAASGCRKDAIRRASVIYSYNRPQGLKEPPAQLSLALPTVDREKAPEAAEKKAAKLAATLKVRLSPDKKTRTIDKAGEILRVKDHRYRFKVYIPSGTIKFRDTALYNQTLEEETKLPPLSQEKALELARKICQSLVAAELVREEELLLKAARFSFRRENDTAGATQGQQESPELKSARTLDTRVFIPRVLGGVGVSGHGVRLTFTRAGKLAGLDLLWRDIKLDQQNSYSVSLDMSKAKQLFEKGLTLPPDAEVNVSVNELVYYEVSMREPVNFLEPVYLFVYEARVPIEGRNEFAVSKLLHRILPAIDHGRIQAVSSREIRLKEVQTRLRTERPEKQPRIEQTEEEEDEEHQP